jgi:TolB protein
MFSILHTMARNFITIAIFYFMVFCNQACKTPSKSIETNYNDSIPVGVLSFLTTRDGNFEIYSMTADGKNVKNLTNNKALDFWTAWSPNGKYILFYSNRDGNNEIYRMDEDGKNPVNISNHPSNDYLPCWSPDGKKIVFTSDRDSKNREIYSMNIDGSNVTRLTNNDFFEEVPTWSKDGSQILFTRQIFEFDDTVKISNGEIFIMDKDGNNEKRLTYRKGFDSGAKFSPNGKQIAFYGVTEDNNFEIYIMNSDGTNITNLTNDILEDYSPDWSPDGKWIAYSSGTSKQYDVWLINIKTKNKIRLTTEPKRNETPVWRPK